MPDERQLAPVRRVRIYERNLVLIGFMGSGKSTIGKICARRLRGAFHDVDVEIAEREGMTVQQIFETHGEERFRQIEREVVAELAGGQDLIIATGGGSVLDPANAESLRSGSRVVLLRATHEIIIRRIGRTNTRPLLAVEDPSERVAALLAERMPIYEGLADAIVDTDDRPALAVANEVVRWFRRQERLP